MGWRRRRSGDKDEWRVAGFFATVVAEGNYTGGLLCQRLCTRSAPCQMCASVAARMPAAHTMQTASSICQSTLMSACSSGVKATKSRVTPPWRHRSSTHKTPAVCLTAWAENSPKPEHGSTELPSRSNKRLLMPRLYSRKGITEFEPRRVGGLFLFLPFLLQF